MIKMINLLSFLLLSVLTFAQSGIDESKKPVEQGPGNPPAGAPIDNYTIALIIVAVAIITYIVYKKKNVQTA